MQKELNREVGIALTQRTGGEIQVVVLYHHHGTLGALDLLGDDVRELLVRRHVALAPGSPLLQSNTGLAWRIEHVVLEEPQ